LIPASFSYHRPAALAEALKILSDHGDDARVLAGGHSLIPMMKMRMANIPHLIDLQDIPDLAQISLEGNRVVIGAMVTQAQLINDQTLASAAPLMKEAALQIADPQVRYMGTVGGNVANGDPANDMPGLMQCLNADFNLIGPSGERTVAARDFYEAAYVTAREDDEILTSISFDAHAAGYAYEKQKRKIGDYATAASAVLLTKDGQTCASASIAMTNLSDTPIWSQAAGDALVGTTLDDGAIKDAVAAALSDIDPTEDTRGPVAFKMHVAGVILTRAIQRAWSRA
jgi:carbon-monoxide dehydrogenase medium subunit